MQKIVPHLWFDKEAVAAAEFYLKTFKNTKIYSKSEISDTPSGVVQVVSLNIEGQDFQFLSAGPVFKMNPSVSFLVACDTKEEVDELYSKLAQGGEPLMELGEYPFSKWYGWTNDKFGVSWQVMHMGDIPYTQKITPTLMFTQDLAGKAEEAIKYWTSVFENSKMGGVMRYEAGEPDKAGTLKHAAFSLNNQQFAAMDSAQSHKFKLNEAISLIVNCENQTEVDYYWEKLSAVPESEQCGWVKDRFGVSWQIVPVQMEKLMNQEDKEAGARVTQAMLKMKKLVIADLESAAKG